MAPVLASAALPFVFLDAVGLSLCGSAVLSSFIGLIRVARSGRPGMPWALVGMALGILFVYPVLVIGPW